MIKCRVCHGKLSKFFSLGEIPLPNSFMKPQDFSEEKKYDLSVGFCSRCYLVQLTKTVPPAKIFRNYIYFSHNTLTLIKHAQETAKKLTKKFKLNKSSLVLEIGSNDGTQLKFYQQQGIKVLGVDPAKNIVRLANREGIKTIPEFFTFKLTKKLRQKKILADVVYGSNVLAHIPNVVDALKGVKNILKDEGNAVFEFPYLQGLLENKFDIIYHEHVFYYSLMSIANLTKKVGLEIYDVEKVATQGGSLRVYLTHPGKKPVSQRVKQLLLREKQKGFHKLTTYQVMGVNVKKLKEELLNLLIKLKNKQKIIVGYGAAAKGNVLLNYFQIGKNYLDYIFDKAVEKQGFYTPGMHLLVVDPQQVNRLKPDYILLLSWNIAGEVLEQLKTYRRTGGKFIIPIPRVKIV